MEARDEPEANQQGVPENGGRRLEALLQDLTATHGRVRAAERLAVNYRTLARSLDSGQLSPTMQGALERYAEQTRASVAPPDQGTGEVDETNAGDNHEDEDVEDAAKQLREELALFRARTAHQLQAVEERLERLEQRERAAPIEPTQLEATANMRALMGLDAQLITLAPVSGEEQAYGAALPLIAEWRTMRQRRMSATHTLDVLKIDERLLELEITLLAEHELTLPPADGPWDGIKRHAELRLRHQSLTRRRRQRRWTQLLYWFMRLISLSRWSGS